MPPEAQSSTVPPGAAAPPAAGAAPPDAAAAAAAAAAGNASAPPPAAGSSADAGAAGKGAATALTVDAGAAAAAAVAATPDWRAQVANGDESIAKLAGRYADLGALGKALKEAQAKISAGIKQPLREGASDEEIKAYRTEAGIPDKPEGYFEKLPAGLVIGEEDKALFTEWASEMHGLNAPPAYIAKTVAWYYKMQEQQAANQEAMDRQHQSEITTALKTAWGRDFSENQNLLKSFLGGLKPETADMFRDATLPDGRRLFNSPEIVQWLAGKAREVNPLAYIPGPGAGDEGKSLDDRIKGIEAKMGSREYINSEPMQAELRALYERRQQLQTRGAA